MEIYCQLESENRGHKGSKPEPQNWADLVEGEEDFAEEFNKIFNDSTVFEADDDNNRKEKLKFDHTVTFPEYKHRPEVLQDTYLNMSVALPRDDGDPEFALVTTQLRVNIGIPIRTANDN